MAPAATRPVAGQPSPSRAKQRSLSLDTLRGGMVRTLMQRGIFGWGNAAWPGGQATALRQPVQRLIPGDGERADGMYAARFGRAAKEKLAELGWLKHFVASGKALHALYSMELLKTWSRDELDRLPQDEAAKALMALCVDGYALAQKGPKNFAPFYFRLVTTLARRIYAWRPSAKPEALNRALALAYAATAVHGLESLRPRIRDAFDDALPQVILPDGGHADGNPESLLRMLLQVIPLREAMQQAREPIPPSLNSAIDRMLPMLRMLTHDDQSFARLRGTRPHAEANALCLSHDEVNGQPLKLAPHSGFARLEAGATRIIADTTPLTGFTFDLCHDGKALLTGSHRNVLSFRRFSTESPAELVDFEDGALLVTGVRIGSISLSRHVFMMAGGLDIRFEDIATGLSQAFAVELNLAKDVSVSDIEDECAVTISMARGEDWQVKMRGGVMTVEKSADRSRIIMTTEPENGVSSLTWALKKLPL